jgi:hypothetical protein
MLDTTKNKISWKEFKDLVEKAGVKNNDEIDSIDVAWGDARDFEITYDADFGWQITLQRI